MRVRLPYKSKPKSYTGSCRIDEADRWRGRNVWYPGRPVRHALKGATTAKAVLNAQGSAEVIVVGKNNEGPNQQES